MTNDEGMTKPENPKRGISNSSNLAVVCAALAVIVLGVYGSLFRADFVGYDDGDYFYQNQHVISGLSTENAAWALTATAASNWHPVTWISHMLDAQLFGVQPGWAHLVNVLIHATNSALLFLLLNRMTGAFWRSAVVATLFALHPSHVESVAWISERKDVLSALFFMLTVLTYGQYARCSCRPRKAEEAPTGVGPTISTNDQNLLTTWGVAGGSAATRWYVAALVSFALGLMSKPMLVTVPFVLLLLDYWPLGRIRLQDLKWSLLIEKCPFFLLTAASCVITYLAQAHGGAVETLEHVPLEGRLANALAAYAAYLGKMLWPSKLAILQLRPEVWPVWQLALSAVVLAAMTFLALKWARKRPWFFVGWFWYVGMLVPVIGLVQVGNQYMADRYTYLPLIGCFVIFAWCGWELAQRWEVKPSLIATLAALLLVVLGVQSFRQARYWQNTETLFGHCLSVTKNNFVAHNILGAWLARNNRFEEAKSHFLASLQIAPEHADSLNNLGVLLVEHGDSEESLNYLREAVRLKPQQVNVFAKLAWTLDSQGKTESAVVFYREALRVQPDNVQVCNNLAWLLATSADAKSRSGEEAVKWAEHACTLTSFNQAPLLGTLAAAYAEAGRFQDAVATAEKAIGLAQAEGQKELVERNRQLLELYRAGKPFHEKVATK